MQNTEALSTFRVQVAAFAPSGMRLNGHGVKVQATSKAHAAEVACHAAAEREAQQVAKFNTDAARLGCSPRTAFTNFKAETVRRFASDNR